MANKFKKGDTLVCIDNLNAEGILSKGEQCVFNEYVKKDGLTFAMITKEDGSIHGFFPERFKVLENV